MARNGTEQKRRTDYDYYYRCYDCQHYNYCDNHPILTATTTRLLLPPSTTTPYYYYDYHSHYYYHYQCHEVNQPSQPSIILFLIRSSIILAHWTRNTSSAASVGRAADGADGMTPQDAR